MLNRLLHMGGAALLLASATFSGAEDRPPQNTASPSSGTLEIGGRFSSTDGDEARFERYRDLRNGANINLFYGRATASWTFDLKAKNAGYRDQAYALSFNSRRLKANAKFEQTPLNYGYGLRTPFDCTAGNCALDPAMRALVQSGSAIGVPTSANQLPAGSVYNSIARSFDLRSRRDTLTADLRISATDNLDLLFGFNSYKRSGSMPYGAAFAFRNALELPVTIDNRETDWTVGVEWASHQGMFHIEYQRLKFDQAIPSFTFDNPDFATDFCKYGLDNQPPGVCYDPSGYSNANGPATGRMSLQPSTSVDRIKWMGMVKLPGRTTANASFSFGANRQNEALIPWTTNSSINTAAVYAAFPELARLPRQTANMYVNDASGTANVSSRAIKNVTLTARYRFNSRNDFTREFEGVEYVRFDAVPEETGRDTHPFSFNRNKLDVSASYTAIPRTAIRVGYGIDELEHGARTTEGFKDKTARVSVDTVGNQYVTLRAMYERAERDVVDLSIERVEEMSAQPALRFYDEAARTRDRGTLVLELMPVSSVGVNLSLAAGKDDYRGADSTQEFGLLDNENTAYSVGFNFTPNAKVNLGADYSRQTFNSNQESRNANPAPDPSWTDPKWNWSLANDEKVNNYSIYLNLIKALAKTEIKASYDYSDSDQAFVHSGPRIAALVAANQFVALPNVTNKWQRATLDVKYFLSEKLGIGLTYWYEKFDVEDFTTINTAGPQTLPRSELGAQTDQARIDWLGGLLTGYGNRPYKGQTTMARLIYGF